MKNLRFLVAGLLAASALAFSPVAQAQMSTHDWYAGLGVGQGKAKDLCSNAGTGLTSCDDTDTGYRIFGGYQINKNFAVEVGYADLGKGSASGPTGGGTATAEWKATTWDFMAVGILPINEQFSVLGKLGFTSWSADLNVSGAVSGSESANGTDTAYALGVQYDFSNQFGVRGEWMTYSSIGDDATTGQSDVEIVGISALFRF